METKKLPPSVPCWLHSYHSPILHILEAHHVLPMGWGGPPSGRRVPLCPTGHSNTHVLLDLYRKRGGRPAWDVERHFGLGERELAAMAWDQFTRR